MPADGSTFFSFSAPFFKFTFFASSIISVFIADYLSIFLPDPEVMEFLSSWAEVDIFSWVILKLIRIEGWVFGTIKRGWGAYYFLTSRKASVSAEISLSFLAYNLKRVINILGTEEILRRLRQRREVVLV